MHTFFINTSDKINISRHSALFDSLMSKNIIKIFNYKLSDLNACAEEIAGIITRNDNISEIYNIIVYLEIQGRNEDALAAEKVASIQIEEVLFSRLYSLGRKPNEALILFGENFTRGAEYGYGLLYKNNVRNAIWNMFPISDIDSTRQIFKKIKQQYSTVTENNLNDYKKAVWKEFTANCSENSILQSESNFVMSTLYEMAESIKNDDVDEINFSEELYVALTNQKEHVQISGSASTVKYAHVRITDSDFHARNRTEYRILMYVYFCAVDESLQTQEFAAYRGKAAYSDDAIGFDTIPEINWEFLASELKYKKNILREEQSLIDCNSESFPMFNSELFQEKQILTISDEMPKLIVDMKTDKGMTVSKLKSSVDNTISNIEEKNRTNEQNILNYVAKITEQFNVSKDAQMSNIAYKDKGKNVESVQRNKEYIDGELDRVDSVIASRRRLSMSATHIDEILKETKTRTDYYFDCLKKGMLVYVMGVIFTLIFAVPYAIIQKSVFTVVHGWLFYIASLAVIIGAYTAGYIIFRQKYKSRIIKVLGILCDKFTVTQKEKKECLDNYVELIGRDIPLSFCLMRYKDEFNEFAERKKTIPEYGTYHAKHLEHYIRYIDNILNELDIAGMGKEPEAVLEYTSKLAIDKDVYRNNTVYSLVDVNTRNKIFESKERGEQ